MSVTETIPVFELFGETVPFPDVLHCERIRDRASELGWTISPHRHQQMAQLLYIEAGSTVALLDGESRVMDAGTCMFIPAKIVHGFSFAPDTEGVVLTFPLNVVNSIGPVYSGLQQALARPVIGRSTERLTALIMLFAQSYIDTGTYRAQVAVGLAHAILAAVAEISHARVMRSHEQNNDRLQQLDALIAEHLADGWRPGDYASALAVSTGHLSRVCREDKGMSTSSYLEAAVMAEACRLLAFTRAPVANVGYRLGFGDPSYFSRRFRAACGQTPSAYRGNFHDI